MKGAHTRVSSVAIMLIYLAKCLEELWDGEASGVLLVALIRKIGHSGPASTVPRRRPGPIVRA